MTRRSRRFRLVTVVFALLQLTLPAAFGITDALRLGAAQPNAPHIEAASGAQCPRAHPDDCIVCRQLATSAITCNTAPGLVVPVGRAHRAWALSVDARSVARQEFQPRAPPELLV